MYVHAIAMTSMTSNKTLFVADVHASDSIWVGRPGIRRDLEFALWQIVNQCEPNDKIIFGGDTVDSKKATHYGIYLLHECLSQLQDKHVNPFFILGNHDPVPWLTTSSKASRDVVWLDKVTTPLRIGDHRVAGISYMPGNTFVTAVQSLPQDVRVLVCHQCFREAFHLGNATLSMDDIPEHIQLVLAGDIHKHSKTSNSIGQTLVYPGSPYFRRCDEEDVHGIVAVSDDLVPTYVPLQGRPILRASVQSEEEIGVLLELVRTTQKEAYSRLPDPFKEDISQPIVVLRVDSTKLPGVVNNLYAKVTTAGGHLFPTLLQNTQVTALPARNSDNLLVSLLKEELSESAEPIAYEALAGFLAGASVEDTIKLITARCEV